MKNYQIKIEKESRVAGLFNFLMLNELEQALFSGEIEDWLERKKNIKFHVEAGDYFGTLATILHLMSQEIKKSKQEREELLEKLKEDLLYLQDNYEIRKRRSKREYFLGKY